MLDVSFTCPLSGSYSDYFEIVNRHNPTDTVTLLYALHVVCAKCCFSAGTEITMENGSYKKIEDIDIGDKVLGYNPNNNSFYSWGVEIISNPTHQVYTVNEDLINVTPEHPFYVKRPNGETCWAAIYPSDVSVRGLNGQVKQLNVGDKIMNSDEEWIEVTNISLNVQPVPVYNILSFSAKNTYFANDLLVYEEFPKLSHLLKSLIYHKQPVRNLIQIFLQRQIMFFPDL